MTQNLAQQINAFIRQTGMAPSRFGRDAVGDPKLVYDVRNGRRLYSDTAQRVLDFMARHNSEQADA